MILFLRNFPTYNVAQFFSTSYHTVFFFTKVMDLYFYIYHQGTGENPYYCQFKPSKKSPYRPNATSLPAYISLCQLKMSLVFSYSQAFSNNGQITIQTKDPRYQDVIGNRVSLSFGDIKKANLMLKCRGQNHGIRVFYLLLMK